MIFKLEFDFDYQSQYSKSLNFPPDSKLGDFSKEDSIEQLVN